MKKIILFLCAVTTVVAGESYEKLVREVYSGKKEYSSNEVSLVEGSTSLSDAEKAILLPQMLSSKDDAQRYDMAIEKINKYINTGNTGWIVDFLKIQRGFLYGLRGDQPKGAHELERLLNEIDFRIFSDVNDPLFDVLKRHSPHVDVYIHDVMCQSIGGYYSDFAVPPDFNKAQLFYGKIKTKPIKDQCIQQLNIKTGGKLELNEDRSVSSNSNKINNPDYGDTSSRSQGGTASNPSVEDAAKKRTVGLNESIGLPRWAYIVAGFALVSVLISYVVKKNKRY